VAAVFKGNGEKIYSHSNTTIYKSTDGGASWTTPYPSIPAGAKVGQIAVSPTDENRIYIAATGRGIYIINNTTANGGTIVLKDNNNGFTLDQFGELNVKTVATDPNNANVVYAGTRASWKGIANGVFRSVDSGNTWTNITQNTFGTHLGVRAISVRPDNSYVYISTMAGTRKYPPPSSTSTSVTTPTVTTGSATDITTNSATLNGTVNANGLSTTAWFEYGTASGSYGSKTSEKDVLLPAGGSEQCRDNLRE